MSDIVKDSWNKVKGEEPDYDNVTGDFRAKLGGVVGLARQGVKSDIAGLEDFEAEVFTAVGKEPKIPYGKPQSAVFTGAVEGSGQARLTEGAPPPSDDSEATGKPSSAKGSKKSASKTATKAGGEAKALKDAAAAHSRDEMSEVNSPRSGGARPMAAETAVGNQQVLDSADKSGAKKSGAKTSAKKSSAKASGKKAGK